MFWEDGFSATTTVDRDRTDTPDSATIRDYRHRAAIGDERRVVTILFCDIVGSTAMAEQLDPEDWADIMHEAFGYLIEPIERYGGTVARLMGDAVLAFFGAPVAHEDDPQRAILTALDIVEGIQPLRSRVRERFGLDLNMRVGINTGLVVVGEFGSSRSFEYTAMGDAINLAARIEQSADPGAVLVSRSTYQLTAPLFTFESLGGVQMRGKTASEPVFQVLGRSNAAGRLWDVSGLDVPLVGRSAEVATLRRVLDELRQGRGQIVSIIGEAGLGKSRLIDEIRREWMRPEDARPATAWLENRLISYESQQPYGALQRRLRKAFGIERHDSPDAVRAKVKGVTAHFPPETGEHAARVIQVVLAVEPDPDSVLVGPTPGRSSGGDFKRELSAIMLDVLRGWNRGEPMLYVLDDAHWIDAASADLLAQMFKLVEDAPIVFLCAFRPETQSPFWGVHKTVIQGRYADRSTDIVLGPLSTADAGSMVSSLVVEREDASRLHDLILGRSEGNPLFVEEIVRSLIERGLLLPSLAEDESRWMPAPGAESSTAAIPASIQALLMQRIDRLDPDIRVTMQQAAVIGRTFSKGVLAEITHDRTDLDRRLLTLQRLDLIVESAEEPDDEYLFRHPLIQEAAYSTILHRRRREFHRKVGEAIERLFDGRLDERAAMLGEHFARGNDPRAVPWFIRAAERALALSEPSIAIGAINQAIASAQELNASLPAAGLLARARAYETLGRYSLARQDLEQALQTARDEGDREIEWTVLINLGMTWAERDYGEAGRHFQEALARAEEISDESRIAHSLNRLGNWYSNIGRPLDALECHDKALAIFSRDGNPEGLAETFDLKGVASYLAGDMYTSADALKRALRFFEERDNRRGIASALALLTIAVGGHDTITVLPAPESWKRWCEYGEQALASARAGGSQAAEAFAFIALSSGAWIRGELGQALDWGMQALRLAEDIQHRQWIVAAKCALGNALLESGDIQTAREYLEAALHGAREVGSEYWQRTASALLAATWIETGDYDRADELLDCVDDTDIAASSVAQRHCLYQRAELTLAMGNPLESLAIIDRLIASLPSGGDGRQPPHLLALRGRALGQLGRPADARADLTQAQVRAEECGYRPLAGRIDRELSVPV